MGTMGMLIPTATLLVEASVIAVPLTAFASGAMIAVPSAAGITLALSI